MRGEANFEPLLAFTRPECIFKIAFNQRISQVKCSHGHVCRATAASQEKKGSGRASYFSEGRALLDSFQLTPFKPAICGEGNVQTIISNYFPQPSYSSLTRVKLETDDGLGEVYVDVANGSSLAPSKHNVKQPVVVVLPGLESNSRAIISRRLINALARTGFKICALNYRSCGGVEDRPNTLKLYHAGFTDDVKTLLRALRTASEDSGLIPPPIFLCGFSLGANVACTLLAEGAGETARKLGIVAAAAAAVPFNPTTCIERLDAGWKGALYAAHLVSDSRRKVAAAVRAGAPAHNVDLKGVSRANRVGTLDEALTAPVWGFRDRFDYYRSVDTRFRLKHISIPTLILNARDDPFYSHYDSEALLQQINLGDAPVRLVFSDRGGHCGFLDAQTIRDPDTGYFQREFASWFQHAFKAWAKQHS